MRNYLLDQSQVEELGVRWIDPSVAVDIDHLEWTLGLGVAVKDSLMIQHKVNIDSKESVIMVRSKVRPLGNAIQQRQIPINEQTLSALLSKLKY